MARHVDEGIGEQLGSVELHGGFLGGNVGFQGLVAELNEIGQRGFIGVPVAPAAVVQLGDFKAVVGGQPR